MGGEQSKQVHGSGGGGGVTGDPRRDIARVDREISRKMRKGVRYNMKVVIRGDKNTGKTCLMKRLQGMPFTEAYIPSTQITTAHIHWSYKASDDPVIVEVWDVVDQEPKQKSSLEDGGSGGALLTEHRSPLSGTEDDKDFYHDVSDDSDEEDMLEMLKRLPHGAGGLGGGIPIIAGSHTLGLDSSMVDVYKYANAAVFMFDITKHWTFEYVKREIRKVPPYVSIVVLANCRDLDHRRTVSREEIQRFIESCSRRDVRCIECSMKNCFGLKELYTYLNLPYLRLKISNLQQQLKAEEEELARAMEEVDINIKENTYERYLQTLRETRRNRTPSPASPNAPPSRSFPETKTAEKAVPATEGNKPIVGQKRKDARKSAPSRDMTANVEEEDGFYSDDDIEDEDVIASTAITSQTNRTDIATDEDDDDEHQRPITDIDVTGEQIHYTKSPVHTSSSMQQSMSSSLDALSFNSSTKKKSSSKSKSSSPATPTSPLSGSVGISALQTPVDFVPPLSNTLDDDFFGDDDDDDDDDDDIIEEEKAEKPVDVEPSLAPLDHREDDEEELEEEGEEEEELEKLEELDDMEDKKAKVEVNIDPEILQQLIKPIITEEDIEQSKMQLQKQLEGDDQSDEGRRGEEGKKAQKKKKKKKKRSGKKAADTVEEEEEADEPAPAEGGDSKKKKKKKGKRKSKKLSVSAVEDEDTEQGPSSAYAAL